MSDALFRQLSLLQAIPRYPRSLSTKELMDNLSEQGFRFDLRSLQRDLNSLSLRFPIVCDESSKPYRWSFGIDWQLSVPRLDTPTALAFYLAERHLQYQLPASIMELLQPQFELAHKQLASLQNNGLVHWLHRVRSLPNGKSLQPAPILPEIWQAVSSALVEQKQIEVNYLSRTKGEEKPFRLHPAGLVSRYSISYLIATVEGYTDLRQFALNRIKTAEVVDAPAQTTDAFDVDAYINQGAFAMRQGTEVVELIADIHPQQAWLLNETPLSEEQTLEPLPESDWYRLTAKVTLDQETLWWIFGLNERIRLHAPRVWVEQIKQSLAKMQTFYEAGSLPATINVAVD